VHALAQAQLPPGMVTPQEAMPIANACAALH